jgi:hypothetical protein
MDKVRLKMRRELLMLLQTSVPTERRRGKFRRVAVTRKCRRALEEAESLAAGGIHESYRYYIHIKVFDVHTVFTIIC